jgi:hypothetical protein
MEEVIKTKKLSAKLDSYIFLAIKISLALSVVVLTTMYSLNVDKIWFINIIAIAGLVCFALMILKEVLTGKLYANNAKKRRKKYLPFLYADKKKTENATPSSSL